MFWGRKNEGSCFALCFTNKRPPQTLKAPSTQMSLDTVAANNVAHLDQWCNISTLYVLHDHAEMVACLKRAIHGHDKRVLYEGQDVTFGEHLTKDNTNPSAEQLVSLYKRYLNVISIRYVTHAAHLIIDKHVHAVVVELFSTKCYHCARGMLC